MTIPQFDDTPTTNTEGGGRRDPNEFIPWDRVAEVSTPRGTRPGLVMIVRPLELIKESLVKRTNNPDEDWKTLVIADIAVLDLIPPGQDQYGMPLDAIAPGSQWRNQLVFPGMLNKAWRDKIGGTMIGVVFMGEARRLEHGTMGKRPFLWRSLAQDLNQVRRGQSFMQARPEFLIPVPRQVQQPPVQPTQNPTQDPWNQPPVAQDPYYQQHSVHPPASPASPTPDPWTQQGRPIAQEQWAQYPPQGAYTQQQPAQGYTQPLSAPPAPSGYQQPDPWAAQASQAARATQASQASQAAPSSAQHPAQGMNTLDQIRAMAAGNGQSVNAQGLVNAQGQPQAQDPPF